MVTQPLPLNTSEVIYPDSDGQPMANNTEQFRWILVIQQNLDWLFADNPDVFVAGDLFWYPIEGKNYIVNAPDVMVVFGRPKGKRGSYLQWQENNIAPQVVFEILSPSNSQTEMERKLIFYERYGVEEYYIYNPQNNQLRGWLRTEDGLDVISEMENWVSTRLGIKFDLSGEELQIYRPDGNKFSSYLEISQLLEQAEKALAAERRKTQLLAEKLRALGVNPDEIE
ncbi:Uma2 family endonuclease [Anabaena aphanizomenioides LEGE 00250]|jgi:Uma2 family endonuclease|uniref:Uma2 family endonuclease n=1 Tax=Sphaerospermopsis aphanizomenoides LEGE 00250 TaxID=2777972 RepID=A0ABR9VJS9_9CYAN|nr:Uma2 family endonuclease [Sphaerospermopsis aphanizomenoides]MBE9238754.1 Uma2 family endonuclease [Sphaerospermopsis aphanizomenoides LEGE 00250]